MEFLKLASHKRAIAYYRHSAEDKQENSVAIQRAHAQKFAAANNIEIVHEEADEGKSGLSANRPGFKNLFNDWILNDRAPPFEYILVYDVSRWGRFQNPDEGAMYQYRCAERGKKLVFVEKGKLEEEQALSAHLITSIERFMAAEFSRQLSNKVFHGCVKITQQGYSAGGIACYGMSRLLLDVNKQPVRVLVRGEHKQISNERVTLAPSNDETTQTVKDIFRLCAENMYTPDEIAIHLNEKHTLAPKGGFWNASKILRILRNETYIGTRIYNKRWSRLKQKSRGNARADWIMCPDAFPAIVSKEIFTKAKENLNTCMQQRTARSQIAARKLQQEIQNGLKNFLVAKNIDENVVLRILRNFPLTISIAFTQYNVPHWCFIISEQMRDYDSIFGIGLSQKDSNGEPPKIFCIPMSAFKRNNFLIFSQSEKTFLDLQLADEQVEEKIRAQVDKMVSKFFVHALPAVS